MACFGKRSINAESRKKIRKLKPWKHPNKITWTQLMEMREVFWDTAPRTGGRKEIWDAFQKIAEALLDEAEGYLSYVQDIVDGAGIIVQNSDLTVCRDNKGFRYELPKYFE